MKKLKSNLNTPQIANMSQIWPDILIPFSDDYTSKLTASSVSKKTKIPRRTASRILDKLAKEALIRYEIEGRNKKYYLDLKHPKTKLLINVIEDYKALKFSIEHKSIFLIIEEILKLKNVVLFGSYSKGAQNRESDIDLLVLSNESKKIRQIARNQTKKVNIHFSTLNDFEKLLKKGNALAVEIIKSHIIFNDSKFIDLCLRFCKNDI